MTLSGGAGDNVRFRSGPRSQGWVLVGGLGAGLSRALRIGGLNLSASANGSGNVYRGNSDINRLTYGGTLSGSHQVSRRGTLSFSDAFSISQTIGLEDLETDGVLLPLSDLKRNRARGDFAFAFGRRSGIDLDVAHDKWLFDDPTLTDGARLSTGAVLSVGVGQNDTGSISYGFAQGSRRGGQSSSHSLGVGWGHAFGRSLTMSASIGLTRIQLDSESATPWNGSAQIAYRGRNNRLDARYRRRAGQAPGLNRERVVDVASLNYSQPLFGKVRVFANLIYSHNTDPFDPSFNLTAYSMGGGLGWSLTRRVSLNGTYGYFRRIATATPVVNGQRVGLSISYALRWR